MAAPTSGSNAEAAGLTLPPQTSSVEVLPPPGLDDIAAGKRPMIASPTTLPPTSAPSEGFFHSAFSSDSESKAAGDKEEAADSKAATSLDPRSQDADARDVSDEEMPPQGVSRGGKSVTYPEVLAAKVASGDASAGEKAIHGEEILRAMLLLREFLSVSCFSRSLLCLSILTCTLFYFFRATCCCCQRPSPPRRRRSCGSWS